MSLYIFIVSFMEPIHLARSTVGVGLITRISATVFPCHVIRKGCFVFWARLMILFNLVLNSEMGSSSTVIHL